MRALRGARVSSSSFPARTATLVTCLWESDSVEDVQSYVDETLGEASVNLCYAVEEQARSLAPDASAGHASAPPEVPAPAASPDEPARQRELLAGIRTERIRGGHWIPPRLRSHIALPSRDPRRCGSRSVPRSPAGRWTSSSIPRSHFALFQKYLPGTTRRSGPPWSGGQWLAVRVRGEQGERLLEKREWRVGGVALLGVRDREARGRLRRGELGECAPRDALERHVEAAPPRDAVNVLRHLEPSAAR